MSVQLSNQRRNTLAPDQGHGPEDSVPLTLLHTKKFGGWNIIKQCVDIYGLCHSN